jgi:hypothetical protein
MAPSYVALIWAHFDTHICALVPAGALTDEDHELLEQHFGDDHTEGKVAGRILELTEHPDAIRVAGWSLQLPDVPVARMYFCHVRNV